MEVSFAYWFANANSSSGAACGNCQYGTLRARFTALHPKAQYFACTFPHNDASHAQLCKLPGAISVGDVGDFRVACALITRPACSPAVVDFQQLENELTSLNRGDLPGFRLLAVRATTSVACFRCILTWFVHPQGIVRPCTFCRLCQHRNCHLLGALQHTTNGDIAHQVAPCCSWALRRYHQHAPACTFYLLIGGQVNH